MYRTSLLAAFVATGLAAGALAHGGATGIVKERMDAMMAMGKAVKAVTPMMSGAAPYDAETMRAAARTFQEHSGEAMTSLFPEGSGGMPSEAKATIWSDWEGFAALAEQLGRYAEGLEAAADNGLAHSGAGAGATMGGGMMGGGGAMGGGAMMGGGATMGGASMMGGARMMSAEHIAAMPADAAFAMTAQVCSSCHERFRAEDD